jgi:hypothetical protein
MRLRNAFIPLRKISRYVIGSRTPTSKRCGKRASAGSAGAGTSIRLALVEFLLHL